MQQPEKSVLLAEAQQSRRIALRALAAVTGSALFFGATQTGLLPSAATLAMDDDDDNSGHGSSNSGSGHGGDDGVRIRAAASQAQIPAGSIEIRIISDDADGFSPNDLTVDLGQSVTFVNTHSDEHTATGSGFDTGIIPEGGIATVVLNEPGIFPYACQIHPVMTGRISVRDENGVVPEPANGLGLTDGRRDAGADRQPGFRPAVANGLHRQHRDLDERRHPATHRDRARRALRLGHPRPRRDLLLDVHRSRVDRLPLPAPPEHARHGGRRRCPGCGRHVERHRGWSDTSSQPRLRLKQHPAPVLASSRASGSPTSLRMTRTP